MLPALRSAPRMIVPVLPLAGLLFAGLLFAGALTAGGSAAAAHPQETMAPAQDTPRGWLTYPRIRWDGCGRQWAPTRPRGDPPRSPATSRETPPPGRIGAAP